MNKSREKFLHEFLHKNVWMNPGKKSHVHFYMTLVCRVNGETLAAHFTQEWQQHQTPLTHPFRLLLCCCYTRSCCFSISLTSGLLKQTCKCWAGQFLSCTWILMLWPSWLERWCDRLIERRHCTMPVPYFPVSMESVWCFADCSHLIFSNSNCEYVYFWYSFFPIVTQSPQYSFAPEFICCCRRLWFWAFVAFE